MTTTKTFGELCSATGISLHTSPKESDVKTLALDRGILRVTASVRQALKIGTMKRISGDSLVHMENHPLTAADFETFWKGTDEVFDGIERADYPEMTPLQVRKIRTDAREEVLRALHGMPERPTREHGILPITTRVEKTA